MASIRNESGMSHPSPGLQGGPPSGSTLRWTVVGAAWVGGLFAALSIYRSVASGGPALQHLNPIAIMTVIGATVGGLIGPMIGVIVARLRER